MQIQIIFLVAVFGVLVITEGIQLFSPVFLKRNAGRIFLYSSGFVFAYLIYIGFLQFRAFQSGPLGLVIGSKSGFLQFLNYTSLHFWNEYLISFVASILFALIVRYFNKKYNERFFENEELYLIALSILLVGYPGFLFYIVAMLLIPTIVSAIFVKKGERLPLYYFWLPTAIATFLLAHLWAVNQSWWALFRFGFA